MDPTVSVLMYSAAAAGAAAFGAVPLLFRSRLPVSWIGWANALAAGLMLGLAYTLLATQREGAAHFGGAVGVLLGTGFVVLTHVANPLDEASPAYGYQLLLVNTLHAASEGIAIGTAMAVSPPFGAFMALAIAVHNVPEGTVFSATLRGHGVRLRDAAALSVAANANQVLLAVATFAVVRAAPSILPWALGLAVGALVTLVLAEPLPDCYRQAGRTSIALVTFAAMGTVVLLYGHAL